MALSAGMLLLGGCAWFSSDTDTAPDAPGGAEAQWDEVEDEAPPVAKPPAKDILRNDIVAVVNDKPISVYDLDQRVALIMVTSGIPNTAEMREKVRQQALDQLETEVIQREEAMKNNMTVSSVDVSHRIDQIAEDSHITMDQLRAILRRGHVSMASFRSQVANQLLWQRAVQARFAGMVNIAPETVDAEMKRLAESADKVHYMVSEIFVAVDSPDQDAEARKNAENYYEQIETGAPFAAIARQFSQNPSAAQGGSIGVVYDGQLAPELNAALAKMKTGDVSKPIRAVGGYYILKLHQRLEPYGTKIDVTRPEDRVLPAELPLARLLLPLPPKSAKTLVDNAMHIGNTLVSHISGCTTLPKIAKEIQGAVYMNLGTVRLSDLSGQIRSVISKTEPGQVAQPFLSDAGVEIFVRCDKAIPRKLAFEMPTREEVEQQMFEEQISTLARRYNRDLRRTADIELKGKDAEKPAPKDGDAGQPAPKDGDAGKPAPKDGAAPDGH